MKQLLLLSLLTTCIFSCFRTRNVPPDEMPLKTIERVAERITRETFFSYKLELAKPQKNFEFLEAIDFGGHFGNHQLAVAFAITTITSKSDTLFPIELSHTDGLTVQLNGKEIYTKNEGTEFLLRHGERNVILADTLILSLKAGINTLLLKSYSKGGEWKIFIQPLGALIEGHAPHNPTIGLEGFRGLDPEIVHLSNWLVAGPFLNIPASASSALQQAFGPEKGFQSDLVFQDSIHKISWTVLKPMIVGNVMNAHPLWGAYSNYNYHTAGVAWVMMQLAEATKNPAWDTFALHYTNFILQSVPFIDYQVNTLHQYRSVNHHLIQTPLLDFTLAPSLPFIERLLRNKPLSNKEDYVAWVERMINYALFQQSRDKDGHFNRLTPEKFTTWTDDMFMGLPFLMLAGQYTSDTALRKKLWDDAVNQVFLFNKQVWDSSAALYQHAQFSGRKVKMPFWSRANGWAVWAVTEILLRLPKDHPGYAPLLEHYRKHVRSLNRLQNKKGFWYNVLDLPSSGNETSGTAIIVMAIARGINHGWLDKNDYEETALKGWKALRSVIESDGTVHGICMGTMCSEDVNYYLTRPILNNDSHGLLGVIAVGIEMQKLLYKP